MSSKTILSVNNLSVSFTTNDGIVDAVKNVSFDLKAGETLSIVGESGSGKSVSTNALMKLLPDNAILHTNSSIMFEVAPSWIKRSMKCKAFAVIVSV